MHVLRSGAGEFVYPANVRLRVSENGSDDPRDISRGDRRSLPLSKRQFDAVSFTHGGSSERKEEALQEDRRSNRHDRQARPGERLLAEPVLPLLRACGRILDIHLGDRHLGHVD